jgi:glycerophosphoryl diester phosphodiesterase
MKYKNIIVSIIFFLSSIIIFVGCNRLENRISKIINKNQVIAHAGGGFDGLTYLNIEESIHEHYNNGTRIFEYDFALSSDDELIGIHYWESHLVGDGYSFNNRMTLEEYEKTLIAGEYTGITFINLLNLMKTDFLDIVIIIDTKESNIEFFYEKIVSDIKSVDENLISRIIPQLYNEEMYNLLENIQPFQYYVYTLYKTDASNQEVYEFLLEHEKIVILTVSSYRVQSMSEDYIKTIHELNRRVFVHTVNDHEAIIDLIEKGVDGIYTDFVYENTKIE